MLPLIVSSTLRRWSSRAIAISRADRCRHIAERGPTELIPVDAEVVTKRALRDCDLFVAIGTSGTVAPASSFVRWAGLNNARRVLLNLEIFDGARELYGECEAGPADELVPRWFA